MTCGCIYIVYGDYDERYYYRRRVRPTTQGVKCSECRRALRPLEEHERVHAEWQDGPQTYRTCDDCRSIIDAFFCNGFIHGTVLEDLQNHIDDMLGEISSGCIVDLTPKARERVCRYIEETWANLEADGFYGEDG